MRVGANDHCVWHSPHFGDSELLWMSSWRWQLMHKLPLPANGRLSLWQRSHAMLSCDPVSEKSPTSCSGLTSTNVAVEWHCSHAVPYWPLSTAGSGWQP